MLDLEGGVSETCSLLRLIWELYRSLVLGLSRTAPLNKLLKVLFDILRSTSGLLFMKAQNQHRIIISPKHNKSLELFWL